jgi:hypothetical protein
MRQPYLIAAMVFTIAATTCASPSFAAQRSGPGPCREAVNGLVSLLDGKMDGTALYRDTFAVVVNTCGPAPAAPEPAQAQPAAPQSSLTGRAASHDLAVAMTDIIEDDKMNTAAFVKTRTAFAQSCAPR